MTKRWEHFAHGADVGVRGRGDTLTEAFEMVAMALTGVITDPGPVQNHESLEIHCQGPDDEVLLHEWLNALIYEMDVRNVVFGRFELRLGPGELAATVWGERVSVDRHQPAVQPKGATFTELRVRQENGEWIAQCVVDV